MKKVVVKENVETTDLRNISCGKYYGILFPNKEKAFIICVDYQMDNCKTYAIDGFTYGNQYRHYTGSLFSVIEKLVSSGKEVFEFEKNKELFKWLAE